MLKKRDKCFFVFYVSTLALMLYLIEILIGFDITGTGDAILLSFFFLLKGWFIRKWFNEQWAIWEKEDEG